MLRLSSRFFRGLGVFIAVGLVVVLVTGMWVKAQLAPVSPGSEEQVIVQIPRGASSWSIGRVLSERGLIRDPQFFRLMTRLRGLDGRLRAGQYRLGPGMSPAEIMDKLARGDVVRYTITIPEGLTVEQIAALLDEKGFTDKEEFLKAARDVEKVRDYLPPELKTIEPLEGYLFPDTYTVTAETAPADLVDVMLDRLEEVLTDQFRARAEQLGLSIHQLLTLASIIEREARVPDERPTISAVYHNRLRIGMKLDADPTVRYALGKIDGPLLWKDLEVDSPYNTYRNPGLPPGPIANPGLASIQAALYPADVKYLYFVARGDDSGGHLFATTLTEHNRNVQAQRR